MDERVKAIREDSKVGKGSCSRIDECFSDNELIEALDGDNIKTPRAALGWGYDDQGLFLEQALNTRWGEDDDPQLKEWNKWNEGK